MDSIMKKWGYMGESKKREYLDNKKYRQWCYDILDEYNFHPYIKRVIRYTQSQYFWWHLWIFLKDMDRFKARLFNTIFKGYIKTWIEKSFEHHEFIEQIKELDSD
jgi:hypothetical protein